VKTVEYPWMSWGGRRQSDAGARAVQMLTRSWVWPGEHKTSGLRSI